jgi:hypothetical protein
MANLDFNYPNVFPSKPLLIDFMVSFISLTGDEWMWIKPIK